MNTLVYVEKRLIVPIGAKLIGSSLQAGEGTTGSTGFNWFIAASLQLSKEKGVETRIAELFPEDIFHSVYDKIKHKRLSIPELCEGIQSRQLRSADVVSLIGKLTIPKVEPIQYDPFDPPEIKIPKTFRLYGEECFAAQVEAEGFTYPVFFLLDSKEIVCYCNHKPVEVVGVLKWSPAYEVGGFSINQILLGAALLLAR